ncbi:hypothetical protein OpiT1DRAFT_01938 [Opitutaceae bacterium TAV1]|nr:hypothetical protein OpiT1DRAFT_01938 [Opitutaceae bacterium TAV1]
MSASRTIVTLKWGTLYGAEYVNRLRRAVTRHLASPHRFVCLTDDPAGLDPEIEALPIPPVDLPPDKIGTGWRKFCIFGPDSPIREGLCLFLDIDIVITGDMERFFTWQPGTIPIIHNWIEWHKTLFRKRPEIGNSSVFRYDAAERAFIWNRFLKEKNQALRSFPTEQAYLTHCIRSQMTYWPEEWVRSFKRHCRPVFPLNLFMTPRCPQGCSIIAFHGRPNPDEAIGGFDDGKLHHRVKPASWVAEYWQ